MNTISTITAYRTSFDRSFWAFDDKHHDLFQELFMTGASDFISAIVGDECEKASLIFSTTDFPEANTMLLSGLGKEPPRETGHTYKGFYETKERTIDGDMWLCPAMCKYFGDKAPQIIYARIAPIE